VPGPYPREFGDDVVRVARSRDDGVTIEQIATDFGAYPMTLSKWMRQADVEEGTKRARGWDGRCSTWTNSSTPG
jgi:transposase